MISITGSPQSFHKQVLFVTELPDIALNNFDANKSSRVRCDRTQV